MCINLLVPCNKYMLFMPLARQCDMLPAIDLGVGGTGAPSFRTGSPPLWGIENELHIILC